MLQDIVSMILSSPCINPISETVKHDLVEWVNQKSLSSSGTATNSENAVEAVNTFLHNVVAVQFKMKTYIFDRYKIDILLFNDDQFVGVISVEETKDFRSLSQRIASTGYIDSNDIMDQESEDK